MNRSTPQGIYTPSGEFLSFRESERRALGGPAVATRQRAGAMGFGMGLDMFVLPNPDPVLRKQGKSIQVYRDLRSDGHVGGCVRRRKAAVRGMKWDIDRGKAKSRVAKSIADLFADLDMGRILGELLDATLYGYQPMEVMWGVVGGFVMPVDLVGKPAEWFCFDTENQLRFRARDAGPMGELVEPRKFLLARQDPSYDNPYGQPDLARCFWPTKFKQGGMDFWFRFLEKYGTPWLVGKQPRSADDKEAEQLLDNLEAMIQDAVAVIPDDSSIEIVEAAGKAGSAEVYREFLMHMRSEVSIALLGQNQTTEADATHASATAGGEVADDIRDADAALVAGALNELIEWVCDLNFSGERPQFGMWVEDEVSKALAERDKTLKDAGATFSAAYFERVYKLQAGDLVAQPAATAAPGPAEPAFAETVELAPDQVALDAAVDDITAAELQAQGQQMLRPLMAALEAGRDEATLLGLLAEVYPDMDDTRLVQTLGHMMFMASVWGRLSASAERVD